MTTFRPDSPVLTLWPGHSCRAPLHGLTIFLSHSHHLVLTLERSVSNNPKLPWPHQTPLLTLGSLFVLFFFSHKLRKTWDPRSWWRYSPLPLGLEPSPLIPHLYRNAEFLHKVLPYQPAWDFPSLLPSVLGWSFFFPSACPFFPQNRRAVRVPISFSLFTFYSQESHLHCRWWKWWGSRVEENCGSTNPIKRRVLIVASFD